MPTTWNSFLDHIAKGNDQIGLDRPNSDWNEQFLWQEHPKNESHGWGRGEQ